MRKAIVFNVGVLVIAMVLTTVTAFAGNTETGNLSGPHFNINIIGHLKGYKGSGDDSSGHSIMIPLKNVASRGELTCYDQNGVTVIDDQGRTTDVEPTGARIYFEPSDHFEIVDRDATDGDARVKVPVGAADLVTGDMAAQFDVWIRVLGKPNTCMNISAFAYDAADPTVPHQDLWYPTGTLYVTRKAGKSTFVRVNELFTICVSWDPITKTCTGGFRSAFNTAFADYFWSILNDGTRLVQVRLYQK